jgi:hypothetical protein
VYCETEAHALPASAFFRFLKLENPNTRRASPATLCALYVNNGYLSRRALPTVVRYASVADEESQKERERERERKLGSLPLSPSLSLSLSLSLSSSLSSD